jgi:hypothetical protein
MVKASEQEQESTQINVVLNWFEELKRRVPSGNKWRRSPNRPLSVPPETPLPAKWWPAIL